MSGILLFVVLGALDVTQATHLPSAKVHSDFSGNWIQASVSGDTDAIMKKLGVNWLMRRIAKTGHYGVKVLFKTVTEDGDHFIVTSRSPAGHSVEEFTVGVGRESAQDGRGHDFEREVTWDGNVVHTSMWRKGISYFTEMFLNNDELVKVSTVGTLTSTEIMRRVTPVSDE
eukprot:CAMPEP_0194511190 /NCGR_PEP_ID=MMETSP0253-20130528/42792_1 /TAXON_ID=2966 /ORGANISM="Noctiluca scintillans" /LENGTH=170 /DNA_ID=CAMNT_0039354503 /DNA_START=47 /DNA_END=556 /DNA_ORIENTATION=-